MAVMMDNYISILDESMALAIDKVGKDHLAKLFFHRFFATFPETTTYFKGTDVDYFGAKKLTIIVTFIRDIIQHPNFAEGHISQEVIRHQMYGLKDKTYYFCLLDSLVISLKEILAETWSHEYETVWQDMTTAFKSIIASSVDDYLS